MSDYKEQTDRMIDLLEELMDISNGIVQKESVETITSHLDELNRIFMALPVDEKLAFVGLLQCTGIANITSLKFFTSPKTSVRPATSPFDPEYKQYGSSDG